MAAFDDARPYDARLVESAHVTPCVTRDTVSLIPDVRCDAGIDTRVFSAVAGVAVDVRAALSHNPSTDAIWAAAVLDLMSARRESQTLDRVIGQLEEVRARDTTNAVVLNDLAVAYLVRGTDRDDPRDLFISLDLVEQASTRDPISRINRFNRAVILERVRVDRQAAIAWQAVVDAERDAGWAAEARERTERLMHADRTARVSAAQLDRSPVDTTLTALVRRDPQAAREHALDSLVARWSRATLARDTEVANPTLARAMAIGRELATSSGDSSVAHVVRELALTVAAGTSRATAAAADAAADGTRLFRETRFVEARPRLASAVASLRSTGRPVLADWSELSLAGVELQSARYTDAERIFSAVAHRARLRHELSLEARARWGLALSQGRRGVSSATEESYRAAIRLFSQVGEISNVGFMQALIADIHHTLGRSALHAQAMYSALDAFHHRANPSLHYAVLLALGEQLSDRGLPHAAMATIREAVLMSGSSSRLKDGPESLARLALEQARLGARDSAMQSATRARRDLTNVPDGIMRARLDAEISRAEAEIDRIGAPERAVTHLRRVASYFAGAAIPIDLGPTLIAQADMELALGDSVRARADLDSATRVVSRLLSQRADRETVRRLLRTQSDVYRRLVAIVLARGDTATAFRYAELARGDTVASRDSAAPKVRPVPADAALIAYLSLGDRLLIWTCRANAGPVMDVVAITPAELSELVTRFVNVIRQDTDARTEAALGRRLYDRLIAPIRGRLGGVRHLTLVVDGATAGVPFAALRTPQGRYLIEELSVSYASRTGPAWNAHRSGVVGRRLFVADPTWEPSFFPDLDRLRSAEPEVHKIRALYDEATTLTGDEATRVRVLRELPASAMLHFAGHARVAPDEPASSHLVLARDSSGFGANVIFAHEIAHLDLRQMQLAILSACGAAQDRARGFVTNGLVQSFLDAGAGGVIASQWEADDDGTVDLMRTLHEKLRSGLTPEEALQQAQLSFLGRHGQTPASNRTRIWSTFRFSTD